MAGVCNYLDASVDQTIEARVICGTVHENGMGPEHTDKFFEPVFKSSAVYQFFRVAACGADADDAGLRYPVPTVTPGFRCAPADVVDDRDSVSSKPIPERPHAVCIINLDRFGEILICGEVRRDRSGEMTENF